MSLRPLVEEDLTQIASIEKESQKAPWSLEQLEAESQQELSEAWVVTDDETDETIYAYLFFRKHEESWQILNIVTTLQFRGLGLAKQLISKLKNRAIQEGVERLCLEVRKDNASAVQLYQKTGFRIERIQKAYYSNGEDAYMMDLELSEEPQKYPDF